MFRQRPAEQPAIGNGHCWRCGREAQELVRDLAMPPMDKIGVCRDCSAERDSIRRANPHFDMSTAPK